MSANPVGVPDYTVRIDESGVLRLEWIRGVDITESKAEDAMASVNELCAGVRHPMIVDMATTSSVTRQARAVFGRPCSANLIALLGKSPVDRVMANFILGISKLPCPTKFFTDESDALAWLTDNRELPG